MAEQKLVVPACPHRENGHLWRFDRERSTGDCQADVCQACGLVRLTSYRTGQVYATRVRARAMAHERRAGRAVAPVRSLSTAWTACCRRAPGAWSSSRCPLLPGRHRALTGQSVGFLLTLAAGEVLAPTTAVPACPPDWTGPRGCSDSTSRH